MPTDFLTHKQVALIVLTTSGLQLALRLQHELAADVHIYASQRAYRTQECTIEAKTHCVVMRFENLRTTLADLWRSYEQLVLFFAVGAAVRLIAPLLQNKQRDPGVVVVDDAGHFAISLISGHVGGANELAVHCASILGAVPVVTTASDVQHTLSVDLLAHANGWYIEETSSLTSVAACIVNGERVAIIQEAEALDWGNHELLWSKNLTRITDVREATPTRFDALLAISDRLLVGVPDALPTVVCRPPTLVLGVGCRRGVSFALLNAWIQETLVKNHIAIRSIKTLASADIKADEEGLQQLAQHYDWAFEVYSVTDLRMVTTVQSPSDRVQQLIGTPSVCEAAALLSSRGGELLVSKQKGESMTMAVARRPQVHGSTTLSVPREPLPVKTKE
ncbi:MAG: cobalamin biosynthesis protein [Ktedonobacteraceae bacterium]